ncbi:hypothetical protein lbkm_2117 [Lachnospiraceae bacterium KM106-2]|nr:hypothetical protein lbkm_2117 [Lachnospiraceae bacterium KM106-2]
MPSGKQLFLIERKVLRIPYQLKRLSEGRKPGCTLTRNEGITM